jgi:hypothetical protein
VHGEFIPLCGNSMSAHKSLDNPASEIFYE